MAILGKNNGTVGKGTVGKGTVRRRTALLGALSAGALVTANNVSSKDLPVALHKPNPRDWPDRGLYAAWLGHSTVLLKIDGYTLLTDPVLGPRCGVDLKFTQVGMKRLVAPALTVDELPWVDAILSSHAHFDHLDTFTVGRLESKNRDVVMARRTSDIIDAQAFRHVTELGWGEETRLGPLRVKAIEVRHWGARLRTDSHRGYNGYIIESDRFRVLFAGDTANTDLFRQVRSSRRIDLALMPIGAYNPWVQAHCNPEEALRLGFDAGADAFLPIHHQTFALGREPRLEPIERFQEVAERQKARVVLTEIGQSTRVES
jgi:L-ascorbate metabolism protein UlaG (beta-lactamase superfamily)